MCGRFVFLGSDTMITPNRSYMLKRAKVWFDEWQREQDPVKKKSDYCDFLRWCIALIRENEDPKYNLISAMRDVLDEDPDA